MTLRATNTQTGGIGQWNNFITVTDGPVPQPTPTPVPGEIIMDFSATPTQGNPTSWIWDFGDGASSTLQNPSHQYTRSGSFPVTLSAMNNMYSGSLNKPNLITVR